uniref:RNase H type-1 domain-containing protein n=1 Tax=Hucho hucho TaxID=62062 RepID=A0A4W5RRK5_9TELE
MTLLTYPDVSIKRCNTVNPADRIPFDFEGEAHDCVAEALRFTKLRPDLDSIPLMDRHGCIMENYFVDGSCFKDHLGNHAGFAVVKHQGVGFTEEILEHCPQPCSAQLAELKALTAACVLGKGKAVNIYTDSAYAHGVCHLFGAVWKQRGFKKSDGTPIQHHLQIGKLMTALMYPQKLAIIKCQAHKKGNDFVMRGNNAADEAAKKASRCAVPIMAELPMDIVSFATPPSPAALVQIQSRASIFEQNTWLQRGASVDRHGVWRTHDGAILATTTLLTLLINDAHDPDHCARGEVIRKIKKQGFWSPYLQATVDEILSNCEICAKNNIRKGITSPIGHIPVPEGPFRHIVMDYVDMIKPIQGKRYMLVIIDRFS